MLAAGDHKGIVKAQLRELHHLLRHVLSDTREPLLVGNFRFVPGFVGPFSLIDI